MTSPKAVAAAADTTQKWPEQLWIVRHGQSAGNVARDAAEAGGLPVIDLAHRDMDVPLSPQGEQQALALGDWFAALPADQRPEVILVSPYLRAYATAAAVRTALEGASPKLSMRVDERLREKEFGTLDRLTVLGIRQRYPELAEQRAHVGKFYFRPPGGESWCDVLLRLRNVLDMLAREYAGQQVLIVAHQVIVTCFRYLLEDLDEGRILAIDRAADVPNCSVTSYAYEPAEDGQGAGRLASRLVSFVAPLREAGAPVTAEPDVPAAPKA